jgi:hypothetical protein
MVTAIAMSTMTGVGSFGMRLPLMFWRCGGVRCARKTGT